ncbi:MAG TPA: replicative DNA helicase [Polyangiaceae bacterium]|nr:replicative DNA helicase [Polyangiaceae bacterium]
MNAQPLAPLRKVDDTRGGRVPPSDLDAEAAVLSAILLDPDSFDRVQEILQPAHFYADANRRIYESFVDLNSDGRPLDIVSVAGYLRDKGRLDQIGGPPYLAQLSDATPAVAHVEAHAKIIREKWRLRQLISTCQRFAAEGYGDVGDVDDWRALVAQHFAALVDDEQAKRAGAAPLQRLSDLVPSALDRAELRCTGQELPIPVPFPQYGEILQGGFWPGVHTVVAGTGAGKSTFMFQTATHAAKAGVPVLFVGLELDEMQTALRAVGEASGTSWSGMYTGRCSSADLDRARAAAPALEGLPFYVEFGTAHGWSPSNLIARAEQIRKAHPTGPFLVVLDFLQLVGADADERRSPDLREKIARAAYCGVHVANKYGAAVVLISSAARDKYSLLAGDVKAAGISTRGVPGRIEPVRTILNPDALIGVGKESGEIEFAASSQTVLIRWPAPLDNGERAIIAAVPKLRYGHPSWVAMSFWQRFNELPFRDIDDLPELQGRGRPAQPANELEERILETVRRNPTLASKSAVAAATTGTKGTLLAVFDKLVAAGKLADTGKGFVVREGANQ